jgi:hypothetical protein
LTSTIAMVFLSQKGGVRAEGTADPVAQFTS